MANDKKFLPLRYLHQFFLTKSQQLIPNDPGPREGDREALENLDRIWFDSMILETETNVEIRNIGGQTFFIHLCYGFDIVVDKVDTNGFWKNSSTMSMNDQIIIFCYLNVEG